MPLDHEGQSHSESATWEMGVLFEILVLLNKEFVNGLKGKIKDHIINVFGKAGQVSMNLSSCQKKREKKQF